MAGRTSRKRPAVKAGKRAGKKLGARKRGGTPDSDVELVKMAHLARRSGVPAPTIKHYIREGLLPGPDVRTSRNMAYYDARLAWLFAAMAAGESLRERLGAWSKVRVRQPVGRVPLWALLLNRFGFPRLQVPARGPVGLSGASRPLGSRSLGGCPPASRVALHLPVPGLKQITAR